MKIYIIWLGSPLDGCIEVVLSSLDSVKEYCKTRSYTNYSLYEYTVDEFDCFNNRTTLDLKTIMKNDEL